MINQTDVDLHKIKWMEAERELAIRGVYFPLQTFIFNFPPLFPEEQTPTISEKTDPQKKFPTTNP